jgi:hypothetical protein
MIRQAAGAAANFDHQVITGQLGGSHDEVEQVEIDEKALAQLALGMNPTLIEQLAEIAQCLPRGSVHYGHLSFGESVVRGP